MTPILEAALEYVGLGLRVLPLEPRSKKPSLRQWQRRATNNPAVVRSWFADKPEANIGLLTGGGWACLDIDPDRGGDASFEKLLAGRELPETAWARTGGGGRHIALRVPVPVGCLVDFLPGLDVRGTDGQIVAYPSVHPTGKLYRWARHPAEGIADSPAWLVESLTAERGSRGDREQAPESWRAVLTAGKRAGDEEILLAQVVARFPVSGRGQRNDRMVQVAASLIGRGFSDDLTGRVIRRWWAWFHGLGLIGTDPSEAPTEIRRTIKSIRTSPKFRVAAGPNHLALCLDVRLSEAQKELLGADVGKLGRIGEEIGAFPETPREDQKGTGPDTHSKSLTRMALPERLGLLQQ